MKPDKVLRHLPRRPTDAPPVTKKAHRRGMRLTQRLDGEVVTEKRRPAHLDDPADD